MAPMSHCVVSFCTRPSHCASPGPAYPAHRALTCFSLPLRRELSCPSARWGPQLALSRATLHCWRDRQRGCRLSRCLTSFLSTPGQRLCWPGPGCRSCVWSLCGHRELRPGSWRACLGACHIHNAAPGNDPLVWNERRMHAQRLLPVSSGNCQRIEDTVCYKGCNPWSIQH